MKLISFSFRFCAAEQDEQGTSYGFDLNMGAEDGEGAHQDGRHDGEQNGEGAHFQVSLFKNVLLLFSSFLVYCRLKCEEAQVLLQ